MKPFNKERALAGDPMVYRNGEKVQGELLLSNYRHKNNSQYSLILITDDFTASYTEQGKYQIDVDMDSLDLYMANKKKKLYIVIKNGGDLGHNTSTAFKNKKDADNLHYRLGKVDWQIIETEIEV